MKSYYFWNKIHNKILLKLTILMSILIIMGCSKDEPAACSNASNISSCSTSVPNINDRPLTLAVNFRNSWYYDQNSHTWEVVNKDNLAGGIFGSTVKIYSNFLNISKDAAISKIYLAQDQYQRQSVYSSSDYNFVPYIEVEYEEGAEYLYHYQKKDLNNNVIYEMTDKMIINNGRAFLPLINAMFDNQFYASDSQSGSRFIHTITISAQSSSKIGSISPTIEFESTFQLPNVDFYVEYADSTKNFNLKDRFKYYFANNTDYLYNDQFKFFTLKEITDIASQVPVDLRIVFQEPPKIKILQEVFFEMPFDTDNIKNNNGKVVDSAQQRGFNFYVQKSEFDSSKDFQMKIRFNNQWVTLQSQRQADIYNVPVGTKWDMEFFYNFNQNILYDGGDGKPLFNPLKPECNKITNSVFLPLQEVSEKTTAISSGGYISLCHPQTNGKLVIPADQVTITPYELTDTFYNHFNYMPINILNKDTGFFNGIRKVTLIAEGCVRVLARQAGTSTWEIKSNSNANCDASSGTNSNGNSGWAYFYAEKTTTIFDNISDYETVPGLKSLMQFFGNKPVKQTPYFKFNGDVNNNRHLY